jgi:hypothetical protein
MAKEITSFEGEPSSIPIFSRELAFSFYGGMHDEKAICCTITTASFGSHGGIEAIRSVWLVNAKEQTAAASTEQPQEFKASIEGAAWQDLNEEIPATHKAILSEWLRGLWNMDKLRGRIK